MTTNKGRIRLRDPQGWNAGILKALALPDGAFKLYIWLRLHARLDTGTVQVSQGELSQALARNRSSIRASLKTLEQAGVCRMEFKRTPGARGSIEITDDYWPYERNDGDKADTADEARYLKQIRAMLGKHAFVNTTFSAADELLARDWHHRGIPVERIGHAILLGCARKYVSWRNGGPRVPIGSLRYFAPVLDELLNRPQAPADYWDYTRYRLARMEQHWLQEVGSQGSVDATSSGALTRAKKGVRR